MSRDLVIGVARATRLLPTLASSAAGLLVVIVPLIAGVRLAFLDATSLLHLSLVITVAGAAFVLDDATLSMSRALPVTPARVGAIRMVLASAVVLPSWVLQLAWAPRLIESTGPAYQGWRLFLEAPTVLVWVWLAAWVMARRRPGGDGSALAAPVLLLSMMAIGFLPDAVALYMAPIAPEFAESRLRWSGLLLVGSSALALVMRRR